MRSFNVLLVDDSPAANFLHKRVISRLGFADRIDSAEHGAEAIEWLRTCDESGACPHPNMILVDINMPVMDGWGFVDAYHEEFGQSRECVIVAMLSTSVSPEAVSRAEKHPLVRQQMEKPLSDDMVRAIMAVHFPDVKLADAE